MPVTDSADAAEPRLQRAIAPLFVTDFPRAMDFYRTRLGFEIVFTYGEPPFYGEIRRGDARLHVRRVDESPFLPDVREREQLLSAYVSTTQVEDLFLEMQAAGVEFHERLQRKPWGADEVIVRDPEGNLLLFGTPASPAMPRSGGGHQG